MQRAGSTRLGWGEYALKLAQAAAERSEDPYIKVGACVLRNDKSVAGVGYNGPPSKINIDWSNRDERRKRVIHAEINALRYSTPGECSLLACTLLPCNDCLKTIAAHGIKQVIYSEVYEKDQTSLDLAREFRISLIKL